jgi:PQQ-dependent catabolism-associated beta-propeller protein
MLKQLTIAAFFLLLTSPVLAEGKLVVSNERGNSLTVLTLDGDILQELPTCGRPRGMHFSHDKKNFFVGCADDNLILVYDSATLEVSGRITNVFAPETFDLHPDGKTLIVSNEEDASATLWDWTTGAFIAEYETGEEPEGVQVTQDGRYAFVASEAADLVHVIDLENGEVTFDIPVDTRPRRFALSVDQTQLYVSAELASVVNVIDLDQMKVTDTLTFLPPGFRKEHVTPVDIILNRSGELGFVALGRANHVGVFDTSTGKVLDYILVGKRAWGLALNHNETRLYVANGLSDDISIVDLQKRRSIKSVKVGSVPYGILVFD